MKGKKIKKRLADRQKIFDNQKDSLKDTGTRPGSLSGRK